MTLHQRLESEVRKEPTLWVGLKAIAVNNDGEILILKRSKDNTQAGNWDVPGGRMDFGEGVDEALRRELIQETGLALQQIGAVLDVSTFKRDIDPLSQIVRLVFWCRVVGEVVLSEEHGEYRWIAPEEANNYEFYSQSIPLAVERLVKFNKMTTEAASAPVVRSGLLIKGI